MPAMCHCRLRQRFPRKGYRSAVVLRRGDFSKTNLTNGENLFILYGGRVKCVNTRGVTMSITISKQKQAKKSSVE